MLKLFVGNIPFTLTNNALHELFSKVVPIQHVSIVKDKYSDRSRGFGFVDVETHEQQKVLIEAFHQKEFDGKVLVVSPVQSKISVR